MQFKEMGSFLVHGPATQPMIPDYSWWTLTIPNQHLLPTRAHCTHPRTPLRVIGHASCSMFWLLDMLEMTEEACPSLTTWTVAVCGTHFKLMLSSLFFCLHQSSRTPVVLIPGIMMIYPVVSSLIPLLLFSTAFLSPSLPHTKSRYIFAHFSTSVRKLAATGVQNLVPGTK